jgi:hypothetical protein
MVKLVFCTGAELSHVLQVKPTSQLVEKIGAEGMDVLRLEVVHWIGADEVEIGIQVCDREISPVDAAAPAGRSRAGRPFHRNRARNTTSSSLRLQGFSRRTCAR